MLICKLRSFDQQPVLVATPAGVTREVKEAEIHFLAGSRDLRLGRSKGALIRLDHHFEPARKRPEQFQHRDIEADARYGQPHTRFSADALIHACKEIDGVSMKHHHPFWLPRGT